MPALWDILHAIRETFKSVQISSCWNSAQERAVSGASSQVFRGGI